MTVPPVPVLRLITRLNVGGPARQALLLTRELAHLYPTTLAAGSPQVSEGELEDPRVQVRSVPLSRPISPLQDARAFFAVQRLLRSTQAKILHTHMAKAGFIGRAAAFRGGGPRPVTVHTFHGHVLEGYFGPLPEKVFTRLERGLAGKTDALIAVSHEVRDSLLEKGIGTPQRFHVIPVGFDLQPLLGIESPSGVLRNSLRLDRSVPLVATLGRLAPIKDHRTLLHSIARIPDVHLAVLGDGELRSTLEEEARSLGIAGRVHFVGWWLEVASALSDVDVVVLTSRNEGTPVSLIEASASATPVVGTDVGGVKSVVLHEETGFLAQVGDVEAISGYISRLIDDPALRDKLGTRGREHVRTGFSKDRLLRDICDLYESLLSTTTSPGAKR